MNRGAVVVEEAGSRERVATRAERAEADAPLGKAPERGEQGRRNRLAHVDAAADEKDLDLAELLERGRRREIEATAREDRPAIEADDGPVINVLAEDAVGHAQRLHRVRDRDQRIVRKREKCVAALRDLGARISVVAAARHGAGSMPPVPRGMSDSDIRPSLLGL